MATGTEARVIADIESRQALGLKKYGTTVEENPLSLRQWLEHQYQELLDAAIYCRRAMEQLDSADDPAAKWREEGFQKWRDDRSSGSDGKQ